MALPIFRPSFGNRPDRIVGRGAVMEELDKCLEGFPGSRERALLMVGQRGMGKTALLLEMADRALEQGYVVARTTCGATMLDNIVELLQRGGVELAESRRPSVKGFSAGAFGFSFGLTFTDEVREAYGFRVKLEMLCDRLAEIDKGVLILVDEVQPNMEPMRQLVTAYQELAGEGKNLAIVMAGLPAVISEVLEERTLTFLNRANKVNLGPIGIGSVRAYYTTAFKRANRIVSKELVNKAADATQGFPYLLQLIGYYLVDLSQDGQVVLPEQLDNACDFAYADLGENVFKAMVRPLSDCDLAFLRAMAQDEGPTHVADLEIRLGVSQGYVQTYRRRLIDAGVIVSPRRGELEFVLPSFAGYVKRTDESDGMGATNLFLG